MIRLKRNHIIFVFLSITIVFILFQLIFVNDLKQHTSLNDKNPKIALIHEFQEFKRMEQNEKKFIFKNYTELYIPLDSNYHPKLYDILPFYHRFNHFSNFEKVTINKKIAENQIRIEAKNKYSSKFITIEEENRFISVKKLVNNQPFFIRGIDYQKQNLYSSDSNGQFKCIDSNQKIPFENLNDNYCDCVDGTDEPGTNACQFGRFYCTIQNEILDNNFIPSSKVDDKICDCCDGSDESPTLKCKNNCQDLVSERIKEIEIDKKALIEKKKYIADGLFKDERLYGPKGVFFRLSKEHFEINWSRYTFNIYPFKKVTQVDENQNSITIGKVPSLIKVDSKHWNLKMTNGESMNCPQPRSSEINLKCGIKNEVISVEEPQKCVYIFLLKTPAAC